MADEPRRSGRATKGQHNAKDREDTDDTPKSKGKGKGKKAKAEPEPEEEEEGEEEEYIRCVCGHYEEEEDEPRAMICCDKCSAWQHNDCMRLPEDYSPDKYFCEQCKPGDHKELLAAMKRGEKPWIEQARHREQLKAERAAKKKGKKGGRKSGVRESEVARTPTIEPEVSVSSKKRKHEESPAQDVKVKKPRASIPGDAEVQPEAPAKTPPEAAAQASAEPSAEPSAEASVEVSKEIPSEAPADVSAEGPTEVPSEVKADADTKMETSEQHPMLVDVAKDAKEISDPTRSKIASNIVKSFIEQANGLAQSGALHLAKGETAKSLGTSVALQVEHAVYQVRSGGQGEPNDAYKDQIRSILNNIKRNAELATQLMTKNLPADKLAAMDPKDMATEEQKQKDAEEKKRMEKQHVLVGEQGPRMRKTHKGDEFIDETQQMAESTTSNAPVRKQSTLDQESDVKSPTTATPSDKPQTMRKPSAAAKGKLFGGQRRKSSSNFDIDRVWSGVQGSPTDGDAPKLPEAPKEVSPPAPTDADADPEVDRLLKDEDNESEPYSPKEHVEEGVVWSGRVNGGSLGIFDTVARFAAGCQPNVENLNMKWEEVIPSEIKLHGRIQPAKADEYLCGLEYSHTTELVIVSLVQPKESHDRAQFDKFFGYLKQKDRYGVGSQHSVPAIKDIYLLPMEIGQPLPNVMKALEHNFTDPVTERSFLVPIVIKWTELPHNAERVRQQQTQQQAVQSPSVGPPVAQTPITPHESQMHFDMQPQSQPQPVQSNGGSHGLAQATPSRTQFSTPPSQQPPQQGTAHAPVQAPIPQHQSPAAANAHRILGPEMSRCQAVIDLIAQAPNAGENEFNIIKECIEENVEAGKSLTVLTVMLQHKYQSQRSSREQAANSAQAPATAQT